MYSSSVSLISLPVPALKLGANLTITHGRSYNNTKTLILAWFLTDSYYEGFIVIMREFIVPGYEKTLLFPMVLKDFRVIVRFS